MSQNVEELRSAYRAWEDSRGTDPSRWIRLFADDIKVRSIADGAPGMEFSMPREGLAQASEYFEHITRDWEMLSCAAEEFIEQGDRLVVVGSCAWRSRATGKAAESPFVHLWRFRGARAVEFREFYDTARAIAATVPD